MNKAWIIVLFSFLTAACLVTNPSPATPSLPALVPTLAPPAEGSPMLALVNGTLIDGNGGEPIPDAIVTIAGDKIQAVGEKGKLDLPQVAQIIDLRGGTILPGFINAHVHSGFVLSNLEAWAWGGVTTVRDLSTSADPPPFEMRAEAAQEPRYARLVAVGPMITVPEGYPIRPWGVSAKTVTNPQEARQAVTELLDLGADLIKIPIESGASFGEAIPMLTSEEVAAILEVAHQRGTRVSAHILVAADLELAVSYGVDDIAHMASDEVGDETIREMLSRDIYWVPTLELWMNVGQGQNPWIYANLERFVAAGGKVALGTDYDGYSTPFELGMPMKEILGMQKAGMTPMQIILAATRNAAVVCNLGDRLGMLKPGYIADILVLDGNPLEDLQTLSKITWVIHNGTVIRSPDE